MLEYKETMYDVTEGDINYLNGAVDEINGKLGREYIAIYSSPDCENYAVDIYEEGLETWTCYTFEEVEMYLKGIKLGLNLRLGKV